MPISWVANLSALIALLPAPLLLLRGHERRDGLYWLLLAAATLGPLAWTIMQMAGEWHAGISATLWVSISASLVVFLVTAASTREAWRLTPVLLPYLFLLGLLATIWRRVPDQPLIFAAPDPWLLFHIAVSVLTYGVLTVAAVAGLAVLMQERALKSKRRTTLTHLLPAIAEGERLQVGLLVATEAVLAVGLLSGMAAQYLTTRHVLEFDHKTLFALLTFAVIGALLLVHLKSGVGGRRSARYVLLAYLLLTLGYPGVKFVGDVLIG